MRAFWLRLIPLFLFLTRVGSPSLLLSDPTLAPVPLTRDTFPKVVQGTVVQMEKILADFMTLEKIAASSLPDLKEAVVGVNHRAAQKLYEYAQDLVQASLERVQRFKPTEIITSPTMVPEWRMLNTVLEQMVRLYRESYDSLMRLRGETGVSPTAPTPAPSKGGEPTPSGGPSAR